jgi:hypothetical protein
VRYPLKTSYRDGTTGDRRSYVIFEPLDLISRLAALVPKPRVNLTRFHGVFVLGGSRGAALAGRLSRGGPPRGGPPRGGPPRGGPPPNNRHRVTITPALRNKTKQALQTG